ncbi:hypothetical protein Brsp07_05361 [Brucella sp. NBRC 14130]
MLITKFIKERQIMNLILLMKIGQENHLMTVVPSRHILKKYKAAN